MWAHSPHTSIQSIPPRSNFTSSCRPTTWSTTTTRPAWLHCAAACTAPSPITKVRRGCVLWGEREQTTPSHSTKVRRGWLRWEERGMRWGQKQRRNSHCMRPLGKALTRQRKRVPTPVTHVNAGLTPTLSLGVRPAATANKKAQLWAVVQYLVRQNASHCPRNRNLLPCSPGPLPAALLTPQARTRSMKRLSPKRFSWRLSLRRGKTASTSRLACRPATRRCSKCSAGGGECCLLWVGGCVGGVGL